MDTLLTVTDLVREAFEARARTLGATVAMAQGTKHALNFEYALRNRTTVVDLKRLSLPWGEVTLEVDADLPEGKLVFTEGGDQP